MLYLLIFTLFLAQYVGVGFLTEGLVAIFRDDGMELKKLGLLYFVVIFWSFRCFWSPFVDKIVSKSGVYKNFIITTQILMILTLLVVGFLDIRKDTFYIVLLSFLMGFLSATNDIASSAFLRKIFKYKNLSFANSVKSGGNLVGHILGAGLALMIYDKFGLKTSAMFLISLILVSIFFIVIFDEEKKVLNSYKLNYEVMFVFLKQEKIWISVMVFQALGICMSYGLLTPVLVDSGWDVGYIGKFVHFYGTIFSIIGAFGISFIFKKLNQINRLLLITILMSLVILSMLFPINGYSFKFVVVFVVALMSSFFMSNVVILNTIIMSKAKDSPVSQIALQSSISMLFQFISFYLGIALASYFGYKFVVILSSFLCLIAFFYILKVRKFIV